MVSVFPVSNQLMYFVQIKWLSHKNACCFYHNKTPFTGSATMDVRCHVARLSAVGERVPREITHIHTRNLTSIVRLILLYPTHFP